MSDETAVQAGPAAVTSTPAAFRALWLGCAFSSAALLFIAEPLLAKWLLPSFGGNPGTWAACMLFFQALLLAGYAYAWWLSRLPVRTAFIWHAGSIAWVLGFVLWAPPLSAAVPDARSAPGLQIPWLLLVRAGLPYALLSSTAPLLQAWATQLGAAVPHRQYAVSNAGSLLGLAAYPWLIERVWPVPAQYTLWLYATAAFALGSLMCAGVAAQGARLPLTAARSRVGYRTALYWLFCAFVPSLFLLAATDAITVDLAATPVLWVLPLGLYLLSFIAAFSGSTERFRSTLLGAWLLASLGLGYTAFAEGSASLSAQLGCVLSALFVAALLCHDALVRARPEPAQLPVFYLWIACGGALGGVYVSWLAPLCFRDYYELELACALTYVVLLVARRFTGGVETQTERSLLFLGLGIALPLMAAAVGTRAGLLPATTKRAQQVQVIERRRSWFGALRVSELDVGRVLTHGRIRHGMQLREPARAHWPTMYFGPGTAVAQVLQQHAAERARRLGVVGLGIGTLAVYGRAQDQLRFYELDPDVLAVAQQYFTFLKASPAQLSYVVGDGRLSLAHEAPHAFDVLVLDAFASDAVPAHLLTREAFAVYLRQLAPDGVILANVSNRHLAVERVVRASAEAHQLACAIVETPVDVTRFVSKVRWAVITHSRAQLAREVAGFAPAAASGSAVLWTDAHAPLWSIIK
ncbi:MAG: hypothetical protein RL701_410 [Pseudomonadota bacterium]